MTKSIERSLKWFGIATTTESSRSSGGAMSDRNESNRLLSAARLVLSVLDLGGDPETSTVNGKTPIEYLREAVDDEESRP